MKRRILSVMLIFCMVLAIAPSALADDTVVFYVGDNQETTYTTLKEAVQALNGESKITLKSGTFTAGTENVSAIPGNVELVIEAGATAEVPANAVQTVLNSEGSIKVKAGGVLKLPNSAGVTEEWFGGALARMFVQSGAVTISHRRLQMGTV